MHEVMKNGFEMLEKVRFFFDVRVNFRAILLVIIIFTSEYL